MYDFDPSQYDPLDGWKASELAWKELVGDSLVPGTDIYDFISILPTRGEDTASFIDLINLSKNIAGDLHDEFQTRLSDLLNNPYVVPGTGQQITYYPSERTARDVIQDLLIGVDDIPDVYDLYDLINDIDHFDWGSIEPGSGQTLVDGLLETLRYRLLDDDLAAIDSRITQYLDGFTGTSFEAKELFVSGNSPLSTEGLFLLHTIPAFSGDKAHFIDNVTWALLPDDSILDLSQWQEIVNRISDCDLSGSALASYDNVGYGAGEWNVEETSDAFLAGFTAQQEVLDHISGLNLMDPDSDGILDDIELLVWLDNDIADDVDPRISIKADSDEDGIYDLIEYMLRPDETVGQRDVCVNPSGLDIDGDGVLDSLEVILHGDLTNDLWDKGLFTSLDGDPIADIFEYIVNGDFVTFDSQMTPADYDLDSDGIWDAVENIVWGDISVSGDLDKDTDGDGIPDLIEWLLKGKLNATGWSLNVDADMDNVRDSVELMLYGSLDVVTIDTFKDSQEVIDYQNENGTDHRNYEDPTEFVFLLDIDQDGYADIQELAGGYEPLNEDSHPVYEVDTFWEVFGSSFHDTALYAEAQQFFATILNSSVYSTVPSVDTMAILTGSLPDGELKDWLNAVDPAVWNDGEALINGIQDMIQYMPQGADMSRLTGMLGEAFAGYEGSGDALKRTLLELDVNDLKYKLLSVLPTADIDKNTYISTLLWALAPDQITLTGLADRVAELDLAAMYVPAETQTATELISVISAGMVPGTLNDWILSIDPLDWNSDGEGSGPQLLNAIRGISDISLDSAAISELNILVTDHLTDFVGTAGEARVHLISESGLVSVDPLYQLLMLLPAAGSSADLIDSINWAVAPDTSAMIALTDHLSGIDSSYDYDPSGKTQQEVKDDLVGGSVSGDLFGWLNEIDTENWPDGTSLYTFISYIADPANQMSGEEKSELIHRTQIAVEDLSNGYIPEPEDLASEVRQLLVTGAYSTELQSWLGLADVALWEQLTSVSGMAFINSVRTISIISLTSGENTILSDHLNNDIPVDFAGDAVDLQQFLISLTQTVPGDNIYDLLVSQPVEGISKDDYISMLNWALAADNTVLEQLADTLHDLDSNALEMKERLIGSDGVKFIPIGTALHDYVTSLASADDMSKADFISQLSWSLIPSLDDNTIEDWTSIIEDASSVDLSDISEANKLRERILQISGADTVSFDFFDNVKPYDIDLDGIWDENELLVWGDLTAAVSIDHSSDSDTLPDLYEFVFIGRDTGNFDLLTVNLEQLTSLDDADLDGVSDSIEIAVYGDLTKVMDDGLLTDTDDDGMADLFEMLQFGTLSESIFGDPSLWDSDDDSIPDAIEDLIWGNKDGWVTEEEMLIAQDPSYNSGPDSFPDIIELLILGKAIEVPVSMGEFTDIEEETMEDAISYEIVDEDEDGIDDALEGLIWNNINDINHDTDGDIMDIYEWLYFNDLETYDGSVNIWNSDVDNDGLADQVEMAIYGSLIYDNFDDNGINGLYDLDLDNDGFQDIVETIYFGGLDYNVVSDSDNDGLSDTLELAVYNDLGTVGLSDIFATSYANNISVIGLEDYSRLIFYMDIDSDGWADAQEVILNGNLDSLPAPRRRQ